MTEENLEVAQRVQMYELKNQALLEKISSLTANYENQIADLRVEVTLLANQLQTLENERLANEAEEATEPTVVAD